VFPINIGVDFGTSFSKICVRGPRSVGAAVCAFGNNLPSDALIPSKFWVDENGRVTLPRPGGDDPEGALVEYPKMALADLTDLKITGGSTSLRDQIERAIEPLCALFVAHLLKKARNWVDRHWRDYMRGGDVEWSANVGVPVAHLDSEADDVFQRVLAVAWEWMSADLLPDRLVDLEMFYEYTSGIVDPKDSWCTPSPEIAAAVQAFVSSREARPSVYVFFDVGGGTLDGVAFKFRRDDGVPTVDFYSGAVEPLGVQVIAEEIRRLLAPDPPPSELVVSTLIGKSKKNFPHREDFAGKIRKLVGKVIIGAKKKDGRNWRHDLIQASEMPRPYYYPVKDEDIRSLVIFTGGGGCHSAFYCDSIASTYQKFGHRYAGVPPYALTAVPRPEDMNLGSIPEEDFHRFLIAYGLSIPDGEGAEVNLPREFEDFDRSPTIKKPEFDYENTKDMFD
jgi:hypothetical protein